jgi:dinuclear metal center YbgI/SA1388 family protein
MQLHELTSYIDDLLSVGEFQDYCPNGLQVQGKAQVQRIVSGVTASQALIDAAVAQGADALLVHHGYFWKGEAATLVGIKRQRIKSLFAAEMSLLAYHLPLDAHEAYGNNIQLGERLGLRSEGRFAQNIGLYGTTTSPIELSAFGGHIERSLQRAPTLIRGGDQPIRRIAWCSGAAQGYIEAAAALGVDAYLSGEISEQTVHLARELGIHYIAAGHHATERYGVQALGEHLAAHFGLEHHFIDIPNPV